MFSFDRLMIQGMTLALAFVGVAAARSADAQQACAQLSHLSVEQLHISKAEVVPAGTLPPMGPMIAPSEGKGLPGHCLVQGTIHPRTGANGVSYGIGFELRMPNEWNGRFLFQGGGGMDGVVNPALGAIPFFTTTAVPALERGYAVVSTDSGHQGKDNGDATFGLDQQARIDYAYAAIGTVAQAAQQIVAAFYNRKPSHSYFMGCSNGGREALMAAERFPEEFDGVVAGNPGFRLSRAAIGEAWDTRALLNAAPPDKDGNAILANALTPSDLALVSKAILDRCDGLDGVKDGLIEAMSACRFQPETLQCSGEKNADCLSAAQVTALRVVFEGAQDSHGNKLYASWPWDAGIDSMGWRMWKLGTSQTAQPNALNASLAAGSIGYYFMTPPRPAMNMSDVSFDTIAGQVAETGAINDATSTLLSSFIAHHGKLLVIHGNSDPVFSANDLRAWWQQLGATNGGADKLAQSARLFLVPGMNHCGGGPALDDFDPLTALENWVENGNAPEELLARGKSFPGRTRPICPYPEEAYYDGKGDVNSASSFHCISSSAGGTTH